MKDEFEFIDQIKPASHHQPSLVMGIGDDAAVYASTEGMREVVCVDTMIEGVHFTKDTLSPFQIGRKALAINVSDLAAMGAVPRFYLVSIAIPSVWEDEEVSDLYKGMQELADQFKMDLIGGDTVSAKEALVITVTAIGQVEETVSLYRSKAAPGDVVFVTGTVGSSAAGLELLLEKGRHASFNKSEAELVLMHQQPEPQVGAGRLCAETKARISLNDISDGVASEASELAEASKVSIYLQADQIPFHPALNKFNEEQKLAFAFNGGEDFQLIGTIEETAFSSFAGNALKSGIHIHQIGEVKEKAEHLVYIMDKDQSKPLQKGGFNHFKK
ncbi:thiamine-phosphate kinase [Alkalihalobacillus sp. FSL R5-0424]